MANANKVKLPDGTYVSLNDERFHIYRTLTGTAADTVSPYSHTKWDVTDSTITEYVDGMVVCLKVPVAGNGTYGTGLQINDLGYKPVVFNVNSMISTRYSVGSVIWCVYNATQTASLYINSTAAVTVTGCWQVQDYDTNTNTIGYQLRTNSSTRPVSSATYRYRLMFSSLDNSKWVPATNSTSTNATSSRTVNQEVINPWGRIVYYSTTTSRTAGQSLSATAQWDRYVFNLGYSFNDGSALDLTFPGPVYIKCTPQAGGGAIIDSTTPYTQSLPSTADGKIYIYLGQAYSASEVELIDYHPVLYHDGSKIAMWTGAVAESDLFDCVMTKENNVWSCDHTWAEIYAAHQAGKLVRLTQSSGSIYMPMSIDSNSGAFSAALSGALVSLKIEVISTFYYDGNHTDYSDDWTLFNEAHPMFSFDYQTKLNGIEAGAQVNVQSDWNQSDSTADDFIKNKPAIPSNIKGIGFVGSNGIYVSDDVRFYSAGASDYSSKFILVCGEPKTFQSGSAHYFYRLNGSSTEYYFGHAITINNGVYKAVLNDGTFSVTEIKNYQADWNAISGEAQILNKPTIPDAVSGVNDGINWTSLTIGNTTKAIPQGGSSLPSQTGNSGKFLTTDGTDASWANVPTELPSITGNAGKVLTVNSGATGTEWTTPSGGLTNYDFTHTSNTTISGSTTTVTFAANTRGSAMLTISADLGLTIACNNGSDNYIWVKNTGSSEVDITISGVTKNSTNVSNVYVPSDGISVPAGGLCEIGIIVNTDGAFLTSRNDLSL